MLISLYIFGGEVIRNFNFAMLLGVVIGTYSSIFIAAPLLGYLGVKRDWSGGQVAKPRQGRRGRQAAGRGQTWPSNDASARRAIRGVRRSTPTATAASASPA